MQVEGNGLPPGSVRPVRGQIALLDTRPPLLSRVVFSGHGYVVPRPDSCSTPTARPPSIRIRRTCPVTNRAPARDAAT